MSTRRTSYKGASRLPSEDEPTRSTPLPPSTAPRSAKSRTTPRNSIAADNVVATAIITPYNDLHRLANSNLPHRPTTPSRQPASVGLSSSRRSARRTPANNTRTPREALQYGSTRRPTGLTPHTKAAVKEQELRRVAAVTPGRNRRQRRDSTPSHFLRPLSRALAPTSKRLQESPQVEERSTRKVLSTHEDDELDEQQDFRPRLSIPLDDDDDESLLLPPMRSAGLLEDENLTQRSIELPRRAGVVGQIGGRLSRGSLGSVRTSDRFLDPGELGLNAFPVDEIGSSFIQQEIFDNYDVLNLEDEGSNNLQRRYSDNHTERISQASGRQSDIRPETISEDENETTFVLPVPQRDSFTDKLSVERLDGSGQIADQSPRYYLEEMHDVDDSEIDQVDTEDEEDEEQESIMRASIQATSENLESGRNRSQKKKRRIKISKYGIQYPSLPVGVVKKLATTVLKTSGNSKSKLNKDTLEAIMQASDWFFEQVSDDLGKYAQHAGRKTIDESDVTTLMKRQRQTSTTTTPFALAQRYLPRELLQDFRIQQLSGSRLKRGRKLDTVEEEDDDDVD